MALTATQSKSMYQFFALAFNAAPGVTYMNQLDSALNSGMSVTQVVEAFTSKAEFTSSYPGFMSNSAFATKFINNNVGAYATDAAKTAAINDITAALNAGWSRGKTITQVFTNITALSDTDATWGTFVKLINNEVAYAKYYTETLLGGAETIPNLTTLRAVLSTVTPTSVVTDAAIAAVLNPAPVPVNQTFTLTAGSASIDEGGAATFLLSTTNVQAGSSLGYKITGTGNAADKSAFGTATVDSNGKASISIPTSANTTFGDTGTLKIELLNGAANSTVVVNDRSVDPQIAIEAANVVRATSALADYTAAANAAATSLASAAAANAAYDAAAAGVNSVALANAAVPMAATSTAIAAAAKTAATAQATAAASLAAATAATRTTTDDAASTAATAAAAAANSAADAAVTGAATDATAASTRVVTETTEVANVVTANAALAAYNTAASNAATTLATATAANAAYDTAAAGVNSVALANAAVTLATTSTAAAALAKTAATTQVAAAATLATAVAATYTTTDNAASTAATAAAATAATAADNAVIDAGTDATAAAAKVTQANAAAAVVTATAIAENGTAAATVFTAPDGAATGRTYSLTGTDAAFFNINASTGAVSIKAAADFETKPSYSFNVTASDGSLFSRAVTLAVTNVNEAPVMTSAAVAPAIAENGAANAVIYTATATDVDAGTTLTYSLGGTDAAFFNINASTGAVSIKAAADFEAKPSYGFSVTASDGALSATQAVTLAVTNVNEAITGVADSAVTPDNTAVTIDVLANDTDIDAGDGKTLSSVTQGANGTVTIVANKAVYTPNPTFLSGTDTFTYIAKDTGGLSTAATTVTVAVNTVNTAPVITAGQAFSVTENANTSGRSVGFVAATDQEGNAIRGWSLSGTGASNFDINQSTGQITQSATAAFNFEATPSYTLTVNAQDTGGLAATPQTITINVGDVREAPVVTSGATATAIAENGAAGAVVYTATVTEVDAGTTPTYSLGGADAAFFNINASTGAVSIINAANFEAKSSYSFNVVASSWGGTLSTTQAVTLAVTNVNETPVMTSAAVAPAIAENGLAGAVVYTATATDVDAGTTLTYSLGGTDAAFFNINASTGAVSIKLAADFEAKPSYSFNVTASDGALSATQAVTLAVTNVNETPVMTSAAVAPAIAENGAAGAVVYTATATDVDAGTTLTYSLGGTDAAFFNINASTGAVSIKAAADFETKSSYGFSVTASDGALSASQAVTLAVTNVNEAPTFAAATATASVPENTTAVGTYLATDVDAGTTLAYTLSGVDAATFNVSSAGVVTFKTAPNFEAPGSGAGTNVYSFNVVATDTGGLSSTQAITATVTNVNEVITGVADSAATPDNTAVTIDVLANDTDVDAGDAKTLSSVTQGANGTVAIVANKAVYTPNSSFLNGTDTFTYIAKDTAGSSSAATTVTVVVNTVNNAPVITAGQVFSVTENTTTMTGSTFVQFTDQEGNSASNWTITGGTGSALFDINPSTGQISAKAGSVFNFEATPSYTLLMTAQDGQPLTSGVQTVTVNVTNVNDVAPVVSSGATAAIAENTAITTVVYQATSTDADNLTGQTATYTLGGADAALFTLTSAGALTFKASPNFEAPLDAGANNVYDVTVTPNDGVNAGTAAAVAITVTNLNDNVTTAVADSNAAANTVAENVPAGTPVGVTALATDADTGATVSYALDAATLAAGVFAVNATTGVVTTTGTAINFETTTSLNVGVTATSSDGSTPTTATFAVAVTNVNEKPVAVADSATASTGNTITIDVAANDTDVDAGTTLTPIIDIGSLTKGGSAQVSGTKITYTSTTGFAGTETFTYKISDGTLTSDASATVTVVVSANTGGTSGNDGLFGTTAAEAIDGLAGDDTVNGGGGLDTLSGGDGNDRVVFNDASAQINGGAGNDTLVVNSDAVAQGFDLSQTSQQNLDTLSKNSQGNRVTTRNFENIDATNAVNSINLNGQNAVLTKTNTNNTTLGGDNVLTTNVIGGSSGDSLFFTQATGTVTVSSLAGDDIIIVDGGAIGGNAHTSAAGAAATGKFNIDLGAGNDYLDVRDTTAIHTIDGGTGNDNILLGTGAGSVTGADGNDTINGGTATGTSATAPITINGGLGDDSITVGSGGFNSVDGGDGNDTITDSNSNTNTVLGGAGNDSITAGSGTSNINGGAGNDTISIANANLATTDTINGGADTDTLVITGIANSVTTTAMNTLTNLTSIEALDVAGAAGAAAYTVAVADYVGLTSLTINEDATTTAQNISVSGLTVGAAVTLAAGATGATKAMGNVTAALTTAGGTTDALTVNLLGSTGLGEVQTITLSNASGTTGTILIGGVAVNVTNGDNTTIMATAITAAQASIIAANPNIAGISNAAGVVSVFYKLTAGNVAAITAVNGTNTTTTFAVADNSVAFAATGAADNTVNTLTTTGFETLTLNSNSSGAALTTSLTNQNIVSTLTDANLTKLNLAGASALTIGGFAQGAATTIASTMTGDLNLTVSGAFATTFTGGNGKNTLAMGNTLLNTDSLTAGTASTDVVTATINGTDATTGKFTIAAFETVNLDVTAASIVDASLITGASVIAFSTGTGGVTVTNLAGGATVGLGIAGATAYTGTSNFALANATGSADVLNIKLGVAATQTTGAITTTGIETINITQDIVATGAQAVNMTSAAAANVTLTGTTANANTQAYSLTNVNAATTNLDASGLVSSGVFTATLTSTTASTLKGTSGDNVIQAGAGSTTFTIGSNFDSTDSVTGGAGTVDVLNATVSATQAAYNATRVTNVETINLTSNFAVTVTDAGATGTAGLLDAEVTKVTVSGTGSFKAIAVGEELGSGAGFTAGTGTFDASGSSGAIEITQARTGFINGNVLKGGSGTTDILHVQGDTSTFGAVTISGFETLEFSGVTGASTFAMTNVTGLNNLLITGTQNSTVTNLAAGVVVGIGAPATGVGTSVNVQQTDATTVSIGRIASSTTGTTDALTVNLNDVTAFTTGITLVANGIENLTFNSTTAAESFRLLVQDANTSNPVTFTLTGGVAGQSVTFASGGIESNVTNINSGTGVNNFVMEQGSRVGSSAMTITGGSGVDSIIMKNAADVLDGGTHSTGGDTLFLVSSSIAGATIDLTSTVDQVTLLNGAANAAVQKGFENFNALGYTGAAVDVTFAAGGSVVTGSATGSDVMRMGAGADIVRFLAPTVTGNEQISGFAVAADKIALLEGGSGWNAAGSAGSVAGVAIAGGAYVETNFAAGVVTANTLKVIEVSNAQTTTSLTAAIVTGGVTNAYVVAFNSTTGVGEIWYDADWTDAAGRVQVATLTDVVTLAGVTNLTVANFQEYI